MMNTNRRSRRPSLPPEIEGDSRGYPKIWRVVCEFILLLLIFLAAPTTGWAEENFFQIIVDTSTPVNQEFKKDSGYAVFVSYEGKRFLMDTGQNKRTFENNMKAAGILLNNLDFVFLTHKHSDHINGVFDIHYKHPSLSIYIPPGGGFVLPEFIVVNDHLKISSNIILMHTHDDSGVGGAKDELSLVIMTKKGPYLFTSNSHTDFFAKLEKAKRLTGQDIYFHSGHAARRRVSPEEAIMPLAVKMKALNVKKTSPSHSDPSHDRIFKEVYGDNYVAASVGKKVPLEPISR